MPALGELTPHARDVLRDDEETRWHAKPDRRAYMVVGVIGGAIAIGVLGVFAGLFLAPFGFVLYPVLRPYIGVNLASPDVWWEAVGGAGVLWVLLLAFHSLGLPRSYRLREYVVTDDRIVRVSGVFAPDTSTLSLHDVVDVDVDVGLLDKLYGTGTIEFQTAGGPDAGAKFDLLAEPYEALNEIQQIKSQVDPAPATEAEAARSGRAAGVPG